MITHFLSAHEVDMSRRQHQISLLSLQTNTIHIHVHTYYHTYYHIHTYIYIYIVFIHTMYIHLHVHTQYNIYTFVDVQSCGQWTTLLHVHVHVCARGRQRLGDDQLTLNLLSYLVTVCANSILSRLPRKKKEKKGHKFLTLLHKKGTFTQNKRQTRAHIHVHVHATTLLNQCSHCQGPTQFHIPSSPTLCLMSINTACRKRNTYTQIAKCPLPMHAHTKVNFWHTSKALLQVHRQYTHYIHVHVCTGSHLHV